MKNTLMLYIRMFFIMSVSLFTSRVILKTLGVEDFGTYNVVGGFVTMFSAFSGMFTGAISRYLTYELGRNSDDSGNRLNKIFSTSVTIQLFLAFACAIIVEVAGIWFINNKLVIPADRLVAANWVLHCSVLTFIINLISVPYNAAIIAHERMSAFAYISVFEVTMKLLIVYALYISPVDKLITYSVLLALLAFVVRLIYGTYCSRHFEECHYKLIFDSQLIKSMSGFAGWNFLGSGTYMLNTQGLNMLINMFFGVTLNAARGIANQVDGAIMQFVNNFLTAVKPQITKNIAAGNMDYVVSLVCKGAKFGYFLMLLFVIPIFLESEQILHYWLGIVPQYTVVFVRLAMIASMVDLLGTTITTAVIATGKVKMYYIIIGTTGLLVLPMTYVAFRLGLSPVSAYISFITVYVFLLYLKLLRIKRLVDFPIKQYVNKVVLKIFPVTIMASLIPATVYFLMPQSLFRLIVLAIVSIISTFTFIYFIGMNGNERKFVSSIIKEKVHKNN